MPGVIKEKGVLDLGVAITCNEMNCRLVQPGINSYVCQAKNVLDRYWPPTPKERKSRVARDYGSQIPENCPMGYDKFQPRIKYI